MQRQDVAEQRNQRPGFFRVPAPEPAPGIICPDATENCARCKEEYAELEHAVKPEMHRRVRARRGGIARISPKQNVSKTHSQRERRVAQGDGKYMNREPEIVAQHRHQRIDA